MFAYYLNMLVIQQYDLAAGGVTSRNQHDELVSYSVVSVTGTSFTDTSLCIIKLFDQ